MLHHCFTIFLQVILFLYLRFIFESFFIQNILPILFYNGGVSIGLFTYGFQQFLQQYCNQHKKVYMLYFFLSCRNLQFQLVVVEFILQQICGSNNFQSISKIVLSCKPKFNEEEKYIRNCKGQRIVGRQVLLNKKIVQQFCLILMVVSVEKYLDERGSKYQGVINVNNPPKFEKLVKNTAFFCGFCKINSFFFCGFLRSIFIKQYQQQLVKSYEEQFRFLNQTILVATIKNL
eukprot:TRINITY_DN14486_c0_g1_i6.p2 TRINITY_DN14486_c0_g1~~TRINITY_DN14486_c0_g1_i6.p2  ORF type:complete len:232 (-),score=1.75 TRINITY_DN14486_c0_g1_i6:1200-1895(-)